MVWVSSLDGVFWSQRGRSIESAHSPLSTLHLSLHNNSSHPNAAVAHQGINVANIAVPCRSGFQGYGMGHALERVYSSDFDDDDYQQSCCCFSKLFGCWSFFFREKEKRTGASNQHTVDSIVIGDADDDAHQEVEGQAIINDQVRYSQWLPRVTGIALVDDDFYRQDGWWYVEQRTYHVAIVRLCMITTFVHTDKSYLGRRKETRRRRMKKSWFDWTSR